MNKKFSLFTVIVSVLVAAILTFNLTFVILNVQHNKEINSLLTENGYLSSLLTVDQVIRENYLGDLDDEELRHAVIRGYLSGIGDKYCQYMTSEEYDAYLEEFKGNAVGIGVNVIYDLVSSTIEIIDVVPDSPAEKSDIRVGDFIVAVNGTKVTDIGYYEAVDLIKGDKGTSVTITVLRDGNEIDIVCGSAKGAVVTCIEQYGEDTAFYSASCVATDTVIKTASEKGAGYIYGSCNCPNHHYATTFGVEKGENYSQLIENVRAAVDKDAAKKLCVIESSPESVMVKTALGYAVAYCNGSIDANAEFDEAAFKSAVKTALKDEAVDDMEFAVSEKYGNVVNVGFPVTTL